jgi:NADP-dependent 3-hydroxy acid dehydrogenase YdfG
MIFWLVGGIIALACIYRKIIWDKCKPNFNGKIVFITGGSSGIGEQLCKTVIALGAEKVIIAARRLDELERVKNESIAPSRVVCLQLDLN